MLEARIWIPALCYLGAAVLLIPGLLSSHLTPALWFDVAGAALIVGRQPAARRRAAGHHARRACGDGRRARAPSCARWPRRSRRWCSAASADLIAGIAPEQAPIGTHPVISPSSARGLEITFLVLLGTLAAGGVILLRARSTYPRDVATAAAS